ncbi:DUF917 domain-containing protein [uncultured Desulfobacter sp.]|uniref:DUF917 domain-containing protein n=1 Tax=uncultured Desulfobacter sp. TaxID=240139 RepID=UPI002AAAB329|nr:DUF917 domain-containing protein [uncultured Desulfobacter sp.]
MMKLGEKELKDIANGACLLASGGGGTNQAPEWIIPEILKIAAHVDLIGLDEVTPKTSGAVAVCMGSPLALKQIGFHGSVFRAWDLLEQTLDRKFAFAVPGEIGSVNTLIAMLTAVKKGIPALDADGSGRAVPTLSMTTYAQPIPISPFTLANEAASTFHEPDARAVLYGKTPADIENMARPFISVPGEFDQTGGVAGWAMKQKDLTTKNPLIWGTVTKARDVGRALRKYQDPMEALHSALGKDVSLIIRGKLTRIVQAASGGFDRGVLTFEDGKKTIHVVNQNENMIAWDAGTSCPVAMAPDGIGYVNKKGRALSNADIQEGDKVYVVGIRAQERLRTDTYLKAQFLTGLKNVGYYGKYVPIENLS